MAKKNSNLNAAKDAKNDEFYTRLEDIEYELRHYKDHFKGKVVLCPCDESEHTNFFKHFMMNREVYGWKKLICVGYRTNRPAEVHIVEKVEDGFEEKNVLLIGNGDFRDNETQKLFDACDVVVTNPPFSLFREFVDMLMKYSNKFVIIGPQNAITYKEFFPLIRDNKIWLGNSQPKKFMDKNNNMSDKTFGNICWYTNMEIAKRKVVLNTRMDYEHGMKKSLYQKYDNYDAINVNKTKDIPMDYDKPMGVPITFLEKYNPEQFEILNANDFIIDGRVPKKSHGLIKDKDSSINGNPTYVRILIRKKN